MPNQTALESQARALLTKLEKATPGPWKEGWEPNKTHSAYSPTFLIPRAPSYGPTGNAEAIVALRNEAPAIIEGLLALLEAKNG